MSEHVQQIRHIMRDAVPPFGETIPRLVAYVERCTVELEAQRDDLLAALEGLVGAVNEIGGARAWFGSLGDDGQGHDEGEILAELMLARCRETIAKAKPSEGGEES